MDVRELLYDNVRGRARRIIWAKVEADFDNNHDLLSEEDQIAYLYNRTKFWYAKFEPLLKRMEQDETTENTKRNSGGNTPKRRGRKPNSRAKKDTTKVQD